MWFLSARKNRSTRTARPRRPGYRPRLDGLEDRCTPSAGVLDPTFGSGGVVNSSVTANAVLIQSNNDIVLAGSSTITVKKSTETVIALARYTPSGSVDTTFGNGGTEVTSITGTATAAVLYPSSGPDSADYGKIVVVSGSDVIRFNPNGSIDTSFGTSGVATVSWGTINGVVIQPNGQTVVSGDHLSSSRLTRFNSNGTLDSSFGTNGTSSGPPLAGGAFPYYLAIQANGQLVAAGYYEMTFTGSNQIAFVFVLERFDANGSLDTTFNSGGPEPGIVTTPFPNAFEALLRAVVVYPSTGTDTADYGKILAVGDGSGGGPSFVGLGRYNTDGTLDTSFGQSGLVRTNMGFAPLPGKMGVAIQADGKIVIAAGTSLQRYNTDGSLDSTFGSGGIVSTGPASTAIAMAIQPDGRIVTANPLARYLASDPEIGSFTASPNPVTAGSSTTLTVSSITDNNPGSTVTQVAIYLDTNGTNTLEGYATQTSPGVWTFTFSTSGLTTGSYTLVAQAQDSYGVFGDPLPLTLQVQ